MKDPILKAISKYRKHPSILTIKRKNKSSPVFTFNHVTKENVINEIRNLGTSKVSQENDIPTKTIKENPDIFFNFIYQSFLIYHWCLHLSNITKISKYQIRI